MGLEMGTVFVLGVTVVFAPWMSPHESDMAISPPLPLLLNIPPPSELKPPRCESESRCRSVSSRLRLASPCACGVRLEVAR
jgi:hypothetical protein